MKQELTTLLSGAGLGATLIYLLDPNAGPRRRALLRDRLVSLSHTAGNQLEPTGRDLLNRLQGVGAELLSLLGPDDVSDEVLVQRVRARLGRYTSHPRAIEVDATEGRVVLSGPILRHEVEQLLTAVATTRGVRSVENELEVHKTRDNVPALQGGTPRTGEKFELQQSHWSPAARLVMAIVGTMLSLYGLRRRGLAGLMAGAPGLLISARAVTNLPLKRLLGVDAGRRAVEVQKTINVAAPVEEVYAFWSNFENFPRFMSNVREVRNHGHGRSHWTVDGPAGVPVAWNAVVTREIPDRLIAWRSEPSSVIGNAGIVHFSPNAQGGTQIHIKMAYNPPAGALGHSVAVFFGSDPKAAMDEDLVHFKTLVEEGKTTASDQTVLREEVAPR